MAAERHTGRLGDSESSPKQGKSRRVTVHFIRLGEREVWASPGNEVAAHDKQNISSIGKE
jgi:hypothetical protein